MAPDVGLVAVFVSFVLGVPDEIDTDPIGPAPGLPEGSHIDWVGHNFWLQFVSGLCQFGCTPLPGGGGGSAYIFMDFLDFEHLSNEGIVTFGPACAEVNGAPVNFFETIKLPRPVETRAVIDDSPWVEPLAELGMRGSWAVLLVNRKTARMLRGSPERLVELPPVEDDVHGQHDQGGWSQARYQRSIEKEVHDHLKRAAEVAFRRFRRSPFDRLLLGGPEEILSAMEERLHPYMRERVAGRVKVDVEASTTEEVAQAAAAVIAELDRAREREALDRLADGVGSGGRGAAGLADTIEALNERRVGVLLVAEGLTAPGVVCPRDGWVGVDGPNCCPVDGTELEHRSDIIERAIELAITQSAEVMIGRYHREELERHGGIGAVLRF